ncbi:Mg2 transporter protein, CorA-like/Zinc transport protein ZntB [Phaffia rhodozyma]|uniref:Mg2 transporter protein, CorA-like/Zinc transport protein ZntB n=1 Tax=Phaffia rhodozyma TaxID=264483 RepID=A0A0F7SIH2_PHARH|nr:Mg2 transporter protein, CorA-like/Zinc transport protein ZntB [Phaffia rhodozyma]
MADPLGSSIGGGIGLPTIAPPASPPVALQTPDNDKHPHFPVLERTRSPSIPTYPPRQPATATGSSTSVNHIAAKVSIALPAPTTPANATTTTTIPALQSSSSRSNPPRFAEQFSTPLRRRHRHAAATADFPLISTPGTVPLKTDTPSHFSPHGESYEDSTEPSLYRGLPRMSGAPGLPPAAVFRSYHRGRQLDEEAISLRSSNSSRRTRRSRRSSSSSSSSSGNSFVSLGRRAVVGALEAVGRGLGMLSSESDTSSIRSRRRRRSSGQRSTGLTDDERNVGGNSSQQMQGTRRRRRSLIQPRRIRAWSFGSFLGSSSSSSSASTFSGAGGRASTLSITSVQQIPRKKRKRTKRRKSMTTAFSSGGSSTSNSSGDEESDHEPPGRRVVPGKKEFSLLFPFGPEEALPAPNFLSPSSPSAGLSPPTLSSSSSTSPVLSQPSANRVTPSPRLQTTTVLSELLTSLQTIRGTPPLSTSSPSNTNLSDSPPAPDIPPYTFPNPPIPTPCSTPPLSTASIPVVPQRLTPAQILNVSPTPSPPLSPRMSAKSISEGRLHPHPLSMAPVNRNTFEKKMDANEKDSKADRRDVRSDRETQKNGAEDIKSRGPWWLDVHCPDWEDMRVIGETLNLHPLTLEDILHQDPREKLEVFSRLDYYLLAIRSIDEAYFKWTDSSPSPSSPPSGQSPSISTTTHDPSVTGLQAIPVDPTLAGTNPDLPFQEKPVLVTADGRFVRPEKEASAPESRNWDSGEGGRGRRGRSAGKVEIVEDRPGKEGLEGVGVGAKNIYLVVLKDGIVSFHFEDVSKHILNVRQQIRSSHIRNTLSSDWIAHGVMDSVVDTFFPLIDFVEEEADAIDSEIIMHDALSEFPLRKLAAEAEAEAALILEQDEQDRKERAKSTVSTGFFSGNWIGRKVKDEIQPETQKTTTSTMSPKNEFEMKSVPTSKSIPTPSSPLSNLSSSFTPVSTTKETFVAPIDRKPTFTWPSTTTFLPLMPRRIIPTRIIPRRMALFLYTLLARILLFLSLHPAQRQARKGAKRSKTYKLETNPDLDRGEILKRMVNMRRLTTGLTRLLGPKREVVGRLRKRVEELGKEGWGGGSGREMGIYFGDIQDHIIELQSTLLHYEYLLSQAQPAYLAQLQVRLSMTRARSDRAILRLSYVAIGILPVQFITSSFGSNVHVPYMRDDDHPENGHLEMFFGILGMVIFVLALFACLIMYFKRQASRSRRFRNG